ARKKAASGTGGLKLTTMRATMRNRRWLLSLLLAGCMAVAGSGASAQDTLKVAIGQLGLWAVDAPRLGQRAGIFKKHGSSSISSAPRAAATRCRRGFPAPPPPPLPF